MSDYNTASIVCEKKETALLERHRATLKRVDMAARAYSMADDALKEYKDAIKKEVEIPIEN